MDRQARIVRRLADIAPADFDALRGDDDPFTSHVFLDGLERHGCLQALHGWTPHHVTLWEGSRLIGVAPTYLKGNSHGEFVFDWRWAEAYERHGLPYYPKLLTAVPYTPVGGARLLAGTGADASERRRMLVAALRGVCSQHGLSSAHLNFGGDAEAAAVDDAWLPRFDWQFHWRNRGYRDFADFLDALQGKKRRNIQQERQRVARAGIGFRLVHGDAMSDADWTLVHDLYRRTFESKFNHPALTETFFRHLGARLGRGVLAVIAERRGAPVAAALLLRSSDRLYGRYWGCLEEVPGLHFETCYYQGIDYAIAEGLDVFEPGAQGEHKVARGFTPIMTRSWHHIAHPDFRRAVARALEGERDWLNGYRDEMERHTPYRRDAFPAA
ncbi:MAG TPA: GNAT family N-acetyltransferase [Xanthomonadaceae bacterium]|nr:GNAT family N-acetyltransferase [Xanthomonadaceae bacterium]